MDHELDGWYKSKKKPLRKWIYAIVVDGQPVGYITLKNIQWMPKRGEMGIAIDPGAMGRGTGQRALVLYLHHVFSSFPLREVWLKTAAFNKRAIACYEKAGFRAYKQQREVFEEQAFKSDILKVFPDFPVENGWLMTDYVYMHVTRQAFRKRFDIREASPRRTAASVKPVANNENQLLPKTSGQKSYK